MLSEAAKNHSVPTTERGKGNKNITLFLLLAVAFVPMLAAYVAFFTGIGVPQHTVNTGTLLPQPTPLVSVFENENNLRFAETLLEEKKWRLVLPITEQCLEACSQNLYVTRQVHIRLGKYSQRVERIALSLAGNVSDAYIRELKDEHPKLLTLSTDAAAWNAWLEKTGIDPSIFSNQDAYFLVDQEGYAMMWYSIEQSGNDLLKDLKRALKYSIDFQD